MIEAIARVVLVLVGLACVAIEVVGTYDFLNSTGATLYQLGGGVLIASVTPFLPAFAGFCWRYLNKPAAVIALVVFAVLCVPFVLLAGTYRTGAATDSAEAGRVRDNRALMIAQAEYDAARTDLGDAKEQAKADCSGKGQQGGQCEKRRNQVATAQARMDTARQAMHDAPTEESDPQARRIKELFNISEREFHIYAPLLQPVTLFVLSTLLLFGGLHPGRRRPSVAVADVGVAALPKAIDCSDPPPVILALDKAAVESRAVESVPARRTVGSVAAFMREMTDLADGHSVSLGDLGIAYRRWCVNRQLEPIADQALVKGFHAAVQKHGLSVRREGRTIVLDGLTLKQQLSASEDARARA